MLWVTDACVNTYCKQMCVYRLQICSIKAERFQTQHHIASTAQTIEIWVRLLRLLLLVACRIESPDFTTHADFAGVLTTSADGCPKIHFQLLHKGPEADVLQTSVWVCLGCRLEDLIDIISYNLVEHRFYHVFSYSS